MAKFWRNHYRFPKILLARGDRNQERTKSNIANVSLSQISLLGSVTIWCLACSPLAAQITTDGTLETEVTTSDNVTEITGGTTANNNLFHSFQDFSVETNNTAFFNNAADIDNIISRVTGNNLSNIDGLIRANGSANLILINPQGINFGDNASLDIGGSFLGSTAESVIFNDGTVLNTDLNRPPLLTVSTPVGLQLGQNSAPIQVSGIANSAVGLDVNPGNTLALVGNDIAFDGGMITAESGRIDLGSVAEGQVSITEIDAGWQLGYESVTQFADIQLLDASILNPNLIDNPTGGVQLQGDNIILKRSQIAAQTLGNATGGNINVEAKNALSLSGITPSVASSSQISNDIGVDASGQGGTIEITTEKLTIEPQSFIGSTAFGAGSAGDISIAANEIDITGTGFLEFQQQYQSNAFNGTLQAGDRNTGIFAGTATTGNAGNISIDSNSLSLTEGAIIFNPVFTAGIGGDINISSTDIVVNASALQIGGGVASTASASVGDINIDTSSLQVSDGANIINLTFGEVAGGNINVIAKDSIDLRNSPLNSIVSTGILTNSTIGSGKGGDISIQANTITIDNAGILSNSGALLPPNGRLIPVGGSGGNINIQADESIEASGILVSPIDPNLVIGAGIGTSTFSASDGGDLTVSTGKLIIRDGASFASAAFGQGDGGELTINATDSVELIGTSSFPDTLQIGLLATSINMDVSSEVSGNSGNISITTPELVVSDGATVDVQSFGTGKAGNLSIIADSILLSNLGNLSASTISGEGGDIEIMTNTLNLNRGLINASVFGSGTSGNIEIEARDFVEVTGSGFEFLQALFFDPSFLSAESLANIDADQVNQGILAVSTGSGQAGEIRITTPNLQLQNGALIATAAAGDGKAGLTEFNIDQVLTLDASIISASTLFAGQGGDILIDANQLEILRGSQLTAATLGSGDGGSVIVNASESVTVTGASNNNILLSSIGVGAQPLPTTTGNGGDLTINTANLSLDDRGTISVGSIGTGNAGSLTVDADSIELDNQSAIAANTQAGGGNIFLNADNIFWRGGSITTATAAGTGNGGNITINADNLVALEASQLTADAFQGKGGNISISTQGLFICGDCQISASSSLGVDGVVDIETLEPTTFDTLDVPQQPTQAQETVAVACPSEKGASNSQLTITGRGGLPNRPQELLTAQSIIEFEDSTSQTTEPERSPVTSQTLPPPARNWYRDAQGTVILTAQAVVNSTTNSANNVIDCNLR
ncbi:MAG: filamentous hemagglutinin N-terminal domain-containing protein [Cyanobacteria bacterium J06638_38]